MRVQAQNDRMMNAPLPDLTIHNALTVYSSQIHAVTTRSFSSSSSIIRCCLTFLASLHGQLISLN